MGSIYELHEQSEIFIATYSTFFCAMAGFVGGLINGLSSSIFTYFIIHRKKDFFPLIRILIFGWIFFFVSGTLLELFGFYSIYCILAGFITYCIAREYQCSKLEKNSLISTNKKSLIRFFIRSFLWKNIALGTLAGCLYGGIRDDYLPSGDEIIDSVSLGGVLGFLLALGNATLSMLFTGYILHDEKSYSRKVGFVGFAGCFLNLILFTKTSDNLILFIKTSEIELLVVSVGMGLISYFIACKYPPPTLIHNLPTLVPKTLITLNFLQIHREKYYPHQIGLIGFTTYIFSYLLIPIPFIYYPFETITFIYHPFSLLLGQLAAMPVTFPLLIMAVSMGFISYSVARWYQKQIGSR